ncbi:MAG: hypothetical protein KKC77_19770 [Proteobacteria bacterium]|nr:hypothetical protein [Pseudomonadota bacterium]
MEKTIKTRYLETTVTVQPGNTINVHRVIHSDDNWYFNLQELRNFLNNRGIYSRPSNCNVETVATIAEIMPKTAEIEREIDRALGEHNGIKAALEAELAAIDPEQSVKAIKDKIATHRYGKAILRYLDN